MLGLEIKLEISFGDLLTIATIIVSISALIIAWQNDKKLKRKEYADRIRRATGTIIAKIERWKLLTLRLIDDIQPLITETDILLVESKDITQTRDFLWKGLVQAISASSQRILDEQIEIAYADLYGYDPRIQILYTSAIGNLKEIDINMHDMLLNRTQEAVLGMVPPIKNADLGNKLRAIVFRISSSYGQDADTIIEPFRDKMIELIQADDDDIINRKINNLFQ
jgi:hypothetical protein